MKKIYYINIFNVNYLINYILLELKEKKVITINAYICLLHRGTEKLIEYKEYKEYKNCVQCMPYLDRLVNRLDYVIRIVQETQFLYSLFNYKIIKKCIQF